jgi:5'-3' exonuclease
MPSYKQGRLGRQGPREDPDDAFGMAKQFLNCANIPWVQMNGVEADDLIAYYWHFREGRRITILSGDKDLLQLLEDSDGAQVEQIRPGDGLTERWTATRVLSERGCTPEQLPMVMALMGDASDGIPGVHGVGIKTAIKMLSSHGWHLHELLSDESVTRLHGERDNVLTNFACVNLRTNDQGLVLPEIDKFDPVGPYDGTDADVLQRFFERFELERVKMKWLSDALWRNA